MTTPRMKNSDRVYLARAALNAMREHTGQTGQAEAEEAFRDLLADLMHLAGAVGWDFDRHLRMARIHYQEELADEGVAKYRLLVIHGDVSPDLQEEYPDYDSVLKEARQWFMQSGRKDGLFYLKTVHRQAGAEQTVEAFDDDDMSFFVNAYTCPYCSHQWVDTWRCAVDNDCMSCGARDISPDESREFS